MVPTHLFLFQHLATAAQRYPQKIAVQDAKSAFSYEQLFSKALGFSQTLVEADVIPGDRVVLYLENSTDFAIAYWGAVLTGAVVTPISRETKASKLAWIIDDCSPKAVVSRGDGLDLLATLPTPEKPYQIIDASIKKASPITAPIPCEGKIIDQDLGCIIYTSGSTGNPKGVMLSHQNLVTASRSVCSYLGYRSEDTLFVTIPLTFDYGMHQLTMAALVGASVFIETDFSAPLFSLHRLATSGATVFPIVPTMAPLIFTLADRFDFSNVRLISSTAAALHPQVIDKLAKVFSNATVFSMYGLTECHRCTYVPPADLERKKGSVGVAIPNTEMWVVDSDGQWHTKDAVGELVIRGATVMKGYWNNPEKTAQRLKTGRFPGELVLFTGDLCRVDSDGFLYFLARSDDILKIRGEKVAPKEVEDVLLSHRAVSEAIVFGKPDALQGHVVHAQVTLVDGETVTCEELRAYCRSQLPAIAVPKAVKIRDQFKRNANGKIDRHAILENA